MKVVPTVTLSALAAVALLAASACSTATTPGNEVRNRVSATETTPAPPVAKQIPFHLEKHGDVRVDPYYWLRERESREVIAYLEAENSYAEEALAETKPLQEKLYQEIVERIPQSDQSVPYFLDGYYYYSRYEPGKEYAVYARKKGSLEADEQVMIDANELAKGHDYFSVRGLEVSSGNDILAFSTDTVGRRIYTLRFTNLTTGEILADVIEDVTGNVAWATDNRTIFYSRQHPETLRSHQIWRHELGTDPASDVLVYEENDETFSSYVYRTRSKEYIVIASSQTIEDEARILRADDPRGEFRVFEPRRRGHEYNIDHIGNTFYVRTNDDALNFRLMKTTETATGRENWTEVLPHRGDVYLSDFELFHDFLVVAERNEGLMRLRVMPWSGGGEHYVEFDEPAYVAALGENPEPASDMVRFVYSSLTTPWSTYDYDMKTHERVLRKRDRVGGGFDPENYVTERLWATARDGRRVPVSLVYRTGFRKDGSAPLLQYGYGSYGISSDAGFNSTVLSLLDRGFVYAIAHVRGGQELGRPWYEEGKLLKKINTFTDFIDVTEFLIAEKYADPERVFAGGGSAGGLLVGAVMNMRPDLYEGIVARVPFVDVVTTMLDEDIPLTTSEYDEWGNPNEKLYYDYMLSYSPYDHIEAKDYPNLIVTTGLHDSQVQYWEPAKWVAKLRAMKTDDKLVLLHTNMEAGHGGASGRFRRHRENALVYAFLLKLAESK